MPLNKALLNILEDLSLNEKEILKKNALDEAILASIGDALVVVDKEGKINFVNQAFEKLVGWKSEEILGRPMVEVVPKESEDIKEDLFSERLLTKVLSGEVVTADIANPFYYIRKDKTRFPVSSVVTPIKLAGEIIGVVEIFRDITKEKGIDKAKTEFVSLASHQLRTPLSTINWYTEMLLAGDAGKMNKEQEKYLAEVYQGSQRMVSLVNALLSVSRMDMGTFILEKMPTDIAALVNDALNEQKFHRDQKQIALDVAIGKKLPVANVDPKLIAMVLQNLISNAVKYTPDKGKIRVALSSQADKKNFLLTVSDTGYGIPKNQQGKIFTKLFRADNVRERDTEGTGLGLYIVKAIIDNSGGKVWFESEEDKGSTFFVEIPWGNLKQ